MQSVGRVYLFKYPSKNPVLTLNGQSEFEQFGYDFDLSLQINSSVIAVSSLTKSTKLENKISFNLNRAGIVQIFSFDVLNLNTSLVSTFKSDRPYSGFGSRVKVIYFFKNFYFNSGKLVLFN